MKKTSTFIASLFSSITIIAPNFSGAETRDQELNFIQVNEGLFSLEINETIDLTDQSLLLALVYDRRENLAIRVGGRISDISIGQRFDLKWPHAPFHLGHLFSEKRMCFLDVINIEDASGGTPKAEFRLRCE